MPKETPGSGDPRIRHNMQLRVQLALRAPDQPSAPPPLLRRQARRRPVRLHMGRVDHHRLDVLRLRGDFRHDRGEHAHPAPPLPSVVERLRRAIGRRCVLLHQPIALNVEDPAQNPPVINLGLAERLRKERLQPPNLRLRQPRKIAHHDSPTREDSAATPPTCQTVKAEQFKPSRRGMA